MPCAWCCRQSRNRAGTPGKAVYAIWCGSAAGGSRNDPERTQRLPYGAIGGFYAALLPYVVPSPAAPPSGSSRSLKIPRWAAKPTGGGHVASATKLNLPLSRDCLRGAAQGRKGTERQW